MSKTKTKAKQQRARIKSKKPKTTWGDVEKASAKTEEKAAAEKKNRRPKNAPAPQTFTEKLKVRLTPKEIADRANEGAKLHKEKEEFIVQRKLGMTHWGTRIKMHDEGIARCASAVLTGEEDRDVLCVEQPDYRTGAMKKIRKDTGEEVVEPRPLRVDERQETLDLPEPPKRPKKADPKDAPLATDITEPQTVLDAEFRTPFDADEPKGVEDAIG